MKKNYSNQYGIVEYSVPSNRFEEIFYHSKLIYSLKHLAYIEDLSESQILEALDKSLMVCYLTGINMAHHFKRIYVFDVKTNLLQSDWIMSKSGLNLMIIQMPGLNMNKAKWIWKLAE